MLVLSHCARPRNSPTHNSRPLKTQLVVFTFRIMLLQIKQMRYNVLIIELYRCW